MADLYSLVHREFGPITTFVTRQEAEDELAAVLRDEPSWEADLRVELFQLVVADQEGLAISGMIQRVRRFFRWFTRRKHAFAPGDRVVDLRDGATATVHWSRGGYSHAFWDDDQPHEDFGGSLVANEDLSRERN